MFRLEIPNREVYEEVRARLDADPSAVVLAPTRRQVLRRWGAVWFAFTIGVAIGWILRL